MLVFDLLVAANTTHYISILCKRTSMLFEKEKEGKQRRTKGRTITGFSLEAMESRGRSESSGAGT